MRQKGGSITDLQRTGFQPVICDGQIGEMTLGSEWAGLWRTLIVGQGLTLEGHVRGFLALCGR